MVYLNAVERGGETLFRRLGRSFTPVPGMALAWNNLQADGPNPFTLHEALPVEVGHKLGDHQVVRADIGQKRLAPGSAGSVALADLRPGSAMRRLVCHVIRKAAFAAQRHWAAMQARRPGQAVPRDQALELRRIHRSRPARFRCKVIPNPLRTTAES